MKWGLIPSFTKKTEKPDHYKMVIILELFMEVEFAKKKKKDFISLYTTCCFTHIYRINEACLCLLDLVLDRQRNFCNCVAKDELLYK